MKMYAPGDEIWFDTVGIYDIPAWRTKQKYYHGTVKYALGHEHGYNYWVDIGFGESVLVHDWNILTRTPYYDDDFIKDVREEYKNESEKIENDMIDRIRNFVKCGNNFTEGFQLGIKDWCKETNHVFEVGEFAKIIKGDSRFRGYIVKVVDTQYDAKTGEHEYWVKYRPDDSVRMYYKQGDLESINEKSKLWEEKEMKNTKINFTKNMLERGMLVITRNGNRYIVMRDANGYDNLVNRNRVITLFGNYRDDLTEISGRKEDDVVKVYGLQTQMQPIDDLFKTDTMIPVVFGGSYSNRDLIWERSEAREMTVAEIEKALGYSIKVVK